MVVAGIKPSQFAMIQLLMATLSTLPSTFYSELHGGYVHSSVRPSAPP